MTAQFEADILLLPQWVQIWMNVIGITLVASVVLLMFSKATRKDVLVILALSIPSIAGIVIMHGQMGMVRLLGLSHVVFWTPLVIYLANRLRREPPPTFFAVVMGILVVVLTITLAFDYYDVIRWIMGERGPTV